ncbi:MAG: hypothetical protein J6X95_03845, partial [Treponema sp.]|nr:hypothetical protein [Treponema sp.]
MNFSFKQFIVPNFAKRLAFMLPAVILMGVFVSVLVEIGWGTDPASFMNLNIAAALGWGLGNTQVLVYGIMLVFTFAFGAQMIGFGTLANMFLIDYVVDFCRWLWRNIGFAQFIQEGTFAARLTIFSICLLLFVAVAAIYMNARMGVAPYDAMPVIISGWIPKVPFFVVRIIFDLSAVLAGVIAGSLCGAIHGSIVGSIAMS